MAEKEKGKFEFIPAGKRKITYAVYALLTLVLALFTGNIAGSEFVDGLVWIVGLFMGGNSMEHMGKGGGGLLGNVLGGMGIGKKPKK